jgi:hypothetical protein
MQCVKADETQSWQHTSRTWIKKSWDMSVPYTHAKCVTERCVKFTFPEYDRTLLSENCDILSYYATSICNVLPKFQDNLSVPFGATIFLLDSRTLRKNVLGCRETSLINGHYSMRNNPEKSGSQLLRGGSMKSHIAVKWVASGLLHCNHKVSES